MGEMCFKRPKHCSCETCHNRVFIGLVYGIFSFILNSTGVQLCWVLSIGNKESRCAVWCTSPMEITSLCEYLITEYVWMSIILIILCWHDSLAFVCIIFQTCNAHKHTHTYIHTHTNTDILKTLLIHTFSHCPPSFLSRHLFCLGDRSNGHMTLSRLPHVNELRLWGGELVIGPFIRLQGECDSHPLPSSAWQR